MSSVDVPLDAVHRACSPPGVAVGPRQFTLERLEEIEKGDAVREYPIGADDKGLQQHRHSDS